jgi:hypothetical protein
MDNQKHNDITSTRGCFDIVSNEYSDMNMPEKITLLKELINEKGYSTTGLALGMLDIYNEEYNKNIKPLELVLSMGNIIDYLLKEEKLK